MQRNGKTRFLTKAAHITPMLCSAVSMLMICGVLIVCMVHRDEISVASITAILPSRETTAIGVMLLLYCFKSLSIVFPCAVLYAVSGIVFPRATALLVNILGTMLMLSLPFWIARKCGAQYVEKIINKHPKMALLKDKRSKNSLFFAFIIRVIGIFPCDLVSAFFGITTIPYHKYLLGATVGFLPSICIFTVMGMSAHDVTSPAFIASVCTECGITIFSCVFYKILKKKQINRQGGSEC